MERHTQIDLWYMLLAALAARVRRAAGDGAASPAEEEPEAHVG